MNFIKVTSAKTKKVFSIPALDIKLAIQDPDSGGTFISTYSNSLGPDPVLVLESIDQIHEMQIRVPKPSK